MFILLVDFLYSVPSPLRVVSLLDLH